MSRGKLEGRVALITGAGRGIGRAIAHSYAREGAAVAITARSVDELQSLVEGIRQNSGKGIAIPADLTDVSTLLRVIEGVIESPGAIDILVNNAGIGSAGPSPVFSFDDALWIRTLALNLTAPYLLTRPCSRHFLRRNGDASSTLLGSIVKSRPSMRPPMLLRIMACCVSPAQLLWSRARRNHGKRNLPRPGPNRDE